MDQEQFSLSWNNFHNNLSSGFQTLFQDEDLVDCTLAAEGRFIKAHKVVLSVCSPYFKELFRANPCKHPIVILQDVNYNALNNLLQFMYQGEVSVGQEEIPAFMKVAEVLKIKGLTEHNDNNKMKTENVNGDANFNEKANIEKQGTVRKAKPLKKVLHTPAKQTKIEKYSEPLLQPKVEPIDHQYDNDDTADESVDLPSTASEQSFSSDFKEKSFSYASDASSPDGTLIIKSPRGISVLINKGHMYTFNHKLENKTTWVCVKQKTLNCNGRVTTTNGSIIFVNATHNHSPLNDQINRLLIQ